MTAAPTPIRRTSFAERHRAARDAVLASQRGRLIEGIVESVGQKGYAATTLTDIVGRARVSRSTFYEHFTNKADCFVAALHAGAGILAARVGEELEQLESSDPKVMIETMIRTYCETLAAEPEFARVIVVDAFTVDAAAVAERDAAVDSFAALYRSFYATARAQNPGLPLLPDNVFQLIPDAINERTRRIVSRGDLDTLPEAAAVFIDFVFHVLGLTAN
jgi:AcrR family transcriptional regulator